MWTLIIFIYAGILADGDSVALTNVSGFDSEQSCMEAGKKSKSLTTGTVKQTNFVCVKNSQEISTNSQ